jgi:NAD(P)-dependent dehydrogenase (short-subunit alcohol dehydrogenase family)
MQLEYVRKLLCLDGKKAIVTGGNSGIGKGIALSLASLGADITFVGRHEPSIAETEAELAALGVKAAGRKADVSVRAEVDRFFDAYCAENGGKLDILVSNASVEYDKRLLDATEEELESMCAVNLKGTMLFAQRAVEIMKEQMRGCIVIVTSVNGLHPNPPQALYSATKAAQQSMMESLAADLRKYNIRVNTLAPGAVLTNIGLNDENRHALVRTGPADTAAPHVLERLGRPEDMGDACACLVSDAFRYMTGATVVVDGGIMLRIA